MKSLIFVLVIIVSLTGVMTGCASQTAPDHFQNGIELDNQNRWEEAIVEYSKAIEASPNNAAIYLNRGQDYIRTLQFDLSIADFSKAIELNPNDEEGYMQRGAAYINKGFRDATYYQLAVADFTKAIELNPTDAEAFDNRGYAYALSGMYALAVADLNKAIELSSDLVITEHAQRILGQIGQGASPSPGTTNPPVQPTDTAGAQVWELTELGSGQVARVFVYAGVFNETDDSPGWWIYDASGNRLYKLTVGGNIFRNSPGDTWRFVGLAGVGGGYQTMGTGEGVANGNFPDATTVSGTMSLTTQNPLGTVTGSGTWSGKRIK
jgi:tetratricopeptide (TPR) repeat protein